MIVDASEISGKNSLPNYLQVHLKTGLRAGRHDRTMTEAKFVSGAAVPLPTDPTESEALQTGEKSSIAHAKTARASEPIHEVLNRCNSS